MYCVCLSLLTHIPSCEERNLCGRRPSPKHDTALRRHEARGMRHERAMLRGLLVLSTLLRCHPIKVAEEPLPQLGAASTLYGHVPTPLALAPAPPPLKALPEEALLAPPPSPPDVPPVALLLPPTRPRTSSPTVLSLPRPVEVPANATNRTRSASLQVLPSPPLPQVASLSRRCTARRRCLLTFSRHSQTRRSARRTRG